MVRARSSGSPSAVRRRESSLNQFDDIAAQQRLAAGEADFGDAETDEEADEAEVFVDGQLGILRAHFAGAAVDAFVVAAIGDGDAEVVNHAAVAIPKRRMTGGLVACAGNAESEEEAIGKIKRIPFSPKLEGQREFGRVQVKGSDSMIERARVLDSHTARPKFRLRICAF